MKKKKLTEKEINKKLDEVSHMIVENHFLNFGSFKIGFTVMVGGKKVFIQQDIRDMVA